MLSGGLRCNKWWHGWDNVGTQHFLLALRRPRSCIYS